MKIKKLRNTLLVGASLLLSSIAPLQAATTADVLFVVDESGSMSGEHAWISTMVTSLDAALGTAGVTNNRYGLVGFGGSSSSSNNGPHLEGHKHDVNSTDFGTAAQLAAATSSLVLNGGTEDGYSGINTALNDYTFRGNAAVNVILVTDEDRDTLPGSTDTYASILALLTGKSALLNAVVNAQFSSDTNSGALGTDGTDSFFADGTGYTTETGNNPSNGSGSTIADYVDMAIASGGAAWNLNLLRNVATADAFTAAFVDIKVAEIIIQPPTGEVPVPAAVFLFAPALLGFMGLRRRAKNAVA